MKIKIIFFFLLLPGFIFAQTWNILNSAPYNGGKQDDIFFINSDTGWSVNGSGKISRTNNGGLTWVTQVSKPGTYFRCIQMIDEKIGFAGNIGIEYFPGVTDTSALYKTIDGGLNWNPVNNISGESVKGLCALEMVKTPFINAGILDTNVTLYGGGRVGGPSFFIKSIDGGNSWTSLNLSSQISMITDIKFISKDTGFVFGGNNPNISFSSAVILNTTNGGQTFSQVYQSSRPLEIIWKASFPSSKIGYATILSYNSTSLQRYFAKTIDGGLTWNESPLVNNAALQEFGIGFVNDSLGWIGTNTTGFQTTNGGVTWVQKNMGSYVNKIRIIKKLGNYTAYAIGLRIYKISSSTTSAIENSENLENSIIIFPNPSNNGEFTIKSENINFNKTDIKVFNLEGKLIKFTKKIELDSVTLSLKNFSSGEYIVVLNNGKEIFKEKIIISAVKP